MEIIFKLAVYGLMATSLVACGGGGGGGGSAVSPVVQDESANGIWTGISSVAGYGSSDTVAFFLDDEFIALNEDFNEFYQGDYTIDGSAISAPNTKGFALNGPYGGTGSLVGVVSSQGTLKATVETSVGTTSNVDLVYRADAYERSLSLSDLAGSWSGSVPGLSFTIVISSSGSFAALGSDGCSVAGDLTIPRSDRNIFEGDLTITGSNCSVNGNYSGLGIMFDTFQDKDTLFIGYSNSSYGFAYEANRN
tara:strand:+ start:247 stop:996 length:750 start_codon:yes stop_codon:yes gene_type:complete